MLLNDPNTVSIRKGPPRPQDATAPIPASANSYEMTSEDDIGDVLTILAASGEAISMYTAGIREAVLGRILSVDPELPHFVMELNEGATLLPGKVTFVASLPTAKVQFRLSSPEWTPDPDNPQLIPMTFPETCAVLNRRATERAETPLGANFLVSFAIGDTRYTMSVFDLSLGGIGMRCAKYESKGMRKGRKLQDVKLELGTETVNVGELEIRFTRPCRSFLLGEQLHLGCMFINLAPEQASKLKGILDRIHHPPR